MGIVIDKNRLEARLKSLQTSGVGDPTDTKAPVGTFYVDTSRTPNPVWKKTRDGWKNTGTFKET